MLDMRLAMSCELVSSRDRLDRLKIKFRRWSKYIFLFSKRRYIGLPTSSYEVISRRHKSQYKIACIRLAGKFICASAKKSRPVYYRTVFNL
jgi:hypothetical protein